MRSAARPIAAAGIALVIVLCRLTAAPLATLQAQSTYPPPSGWQFEAGQGGGATGALGGGGFSTGMPGSGMREGGAHHNGLTQGGFPGNYVQGGPLQGYWAPAFNQPPNSAAAPSPSGPPSFGRTARAGLRRRTILRMPSPMTAEGKLPTIQPQVFIETQDAGRDDDGPDDVGAPFRRTSLQSVLARQREMTDPDGVGAPSRRSSLQSVFARQREMIDPPGTAPESLALPGTETLPLPGGEFPGTVEPLFGDIIDGNYMVPTAVPRPGFFLQMASALRRSRERAGIGRERVALAPLEIEASQPTNNLVTRFESVYGLQYPDRSSYFWARSGALPRGKGPPLIEKSVDYQDLRFRMEAGGAKFSVTTEMYLRDLNPVVNGNTGGFGDMNVATKLVMVDGSNLQISQVFRTYIPTGAYGKGLGVGHVSLEPGMLMRYKQSDFTYWHGALKFWVPIGGDFQQQGQVLRYGFGSSHLLYDSDRFAIMPTAEFAGLVFLDGLKTIYPSGYSAPVGDDFVINFYPGVRIVQDNGGDLGLVEYGVGGGFTLGSNGWYNGLLRVDMRLTY